jgi:ATP-dependent Clp protease adaptor protein ClpS
MPSFTEPSVRPGRTAKGDTRSDDRLAPTYYVICWNDPVNLMVYVTHVFMRIFGWERQKAEKHMREVHEKGKSTLVRESAEKAEFYVHQLQSYKLQATMEPAE